MCEHFDKTAIAIATEAEAPWRSFGGAGAESGAVREASPSAFPAAGGLAFVPLSSDETSFPTIAAPPPEYRTGSGGAIEDGAKPRGTVSVDDETLRRMSLTIFRDLGLKEAAIAAYFARYDRPTHRRA